MKETINKWNNYTVGLSKITKIKIIILKSKFWSKIAYKNNLKLLVNKKALCISILSLQINISSLI